MSVCINVLKQKLWRHGRQYPTGVRYFGITDTLTKMVTGKVDENRGIMLNFRLH
jgi:hypothetical protein